MVKKLLKLIRNNKNVSKAKTFGLASAQLIMKVSII